MESKESIGCLMEEEICLGRVVKGISSSKERIVLSVNSRDRIKVETLDEVNKNKVRLTEYILLKKGEGNLELESAETRKYQEKIN